MVGALVRSSRCTPLILNEVSTGLAEIFSNVKTFLMELRTAEVAEGIQEGERVNQAGTALQAMQHGLPFSDVMLQNFRMYVAPDVAYNNHGTV